MGKRHLKWIDYARAIGMILVVLGHAMADTVVAQSKTANMIFRSIYSFHMPLFFFLAGFVAVKALGVQSFEEKKTYLVRRFERLIVPYIFVGILYIPLKIVLSSEARTSVDGCVFLEMLMGNNPHFQLWTLYVLFLCALIMCVLNKSGILVIVVSALVVKIAASFVEIEVFGIEALFDNFLYFALGAYVNQECKSIEVTKKKIALSGGIWFAAVTLLQQYELVLLKIAAAISGISMVCLICRRLETKEIKALEIIGKYSMDIYIMANLPQVVVRSLLLQRLGIAPVICCATSIALGLTMPILVSKYVIRKVPVLRLLVLGERSKS